MTTNEYKNLMELMVQIKNIQLSSAVNNIQSHTLELLKYYMEFNYKFLEIDLNKITSNEENALYKNAYYLKAMISEGIYSIALNEATAYSSTTATDCKIILEKLKENLNKIISKLENYPYLYYPLREERLEFENSLNHNK